MEEIARTIRVDAPVDVCYREWSRFENFPKFMEGVKEVRRVGTDRMQWRAEIGGKEKEWEAMITEDLPDEEISWRSVSGAPNAGAVRFQPVGEHSSKIELVMNYDPESWVEEVGDAIGVLSSRVKGDLERFKDYVEEEAVETTRPRTGTRTKKRTGTTRKAKTTRARTTTARRTTTRRKTTKRRRSTKAATKTPARSRTRYRTTRSQ